jgi:N-hydroxyarylamine O-acetyltransferase
MNEDDVAAYLARIRHAGSRAPTIETLRALHRAHLYAVPFENLDIHLGRPIRLDRAAFFRKIVGERRGGFCYELNGLFAALLAALGFEVSLLSARVAGDGGSFGPEFDHLMVLVTAGERWLVDVGFGRSFQDPLSLDAPRDEEAEGTLYRVVPAGDAWHVASRSPGGEARAELAFTLAPHPLEAFAEMCAHHQTSPTSPFTRKRVCSLPTAIGRLTLTGRSLVETVGSERRETTIEDSAVATVLADRFGIRLPRPLPAQALPA